MIYNAHDKKKSKSKDTGLNIEIIEFSILCHLIYDKSSIDGEYNTSKNIIDDIFNIDSVEKFYDID